jgi:hypothetical protein
VVKAINLTNVYKKYKGLWVAFKDHESNEVVASAKTLQQVISDAKKSGHPEATVMRIPEELHITVLPAQGSV